MKASKTNHNSWKALQLMCIYLAKIYWGSSASCLFTVLYFKSSVKKTLSSKSFTSRLRNIFNFERHDLIFDSIKAVRGSYHKRPDKNSIFKYLMSLQKWKKYIFKIGLTSYLNQTKLESKSIKVVTRTLLIITKIWILINSQKQAKQSVALRRMILKVVWKMVIILN